MSTNRPPNPALKHYRNDAKQLLRALQAGSEAAATRIAAHLPRLSDAAVDAVLAADVKLQEAQHVVAREHGYAQWSQLPEAARVFEDIVYLSDAEIRVLLREVGEADLALALKALETGAMSRRHQAVLGMLRQVSEEVRASLRRLAQSLDASQAQIEAALTRIAKQADQLSNQGFLRNPSPDDGLPTSPESVLLPPAAEVLLQPLESVELASLRTALLALGEECGDDLRPLEPMVPRELEGFVWDHLRQAFDGFEPELVQDLMETRAETLTHLAETRRKIIVEAMASVAAGDNPRIVAIKLSTIYHQDPPQAFRDSEGTLELAQARLAVHPASSFGLHELAEFLVDVAWLNRRAGALRDDGSAVLEELADVVDDEFLAMGLRAVARRGSHLFRPWQDLKEEERGEVREMVRDMTVVLERDVEQIRARYALVIEGIVALAEGKRGDALVAALG